MGLYNVETSLKPRDTTGNVETNFLVYGNSSTLGFDDNIWSFKTKDQTYSYYPQLKTFSNSDNENIVKRSNEAFRIDHTNGLGTSTTPFVVDTLDELVEIAANTENGNTLYKVYYKFVDGVDNFELTDYNPIGTTDLPFEGNFNGNGVNFNITLSLGENYVGIFGNIKTGTIENFSVTGSIIGNSYVGIIGYQASGTVKNIYNVATIEATGSYAGGIVGQQIGGLITNTINFGSIKASKNAGGIAGGNSSTTSITQSYSKGTVEVSTVNTAYGVSSTIDANSKSYYDLNIIAKMVVAPGYKPHSTKGSNGAVETDALLVDASTNLSLSTDNYTFLAVDGEYAYYPQLNVFSGHSLDGVKNRLKELVKVFIGDGLGTENFPFYIYNSNDMVKLSEDVAGGAVYYNSYFKVADGVDEIVLDDFTPIGNSTYSFQGNFDGNGANFAVTINKPDQDNVGLFGFVNNPSSVIKNLSISGSIIGLNNVGSVVGRLSQGTVNQVYNKADVTAKVSYAGGIVGYIGNISSWGYGDRPTIYLGYVYNSINFGHVKAETNHSYGIGSIDYYSGYYNSGYLGRIEKSYNVGLVETPGSNKAGITYQHNISNTYYDVTRMASYPTISANKPNRTIGYKDSEFFLYGNATTLGFDEDIWVFTPKDTEYSYYPQLRIFAENSSEAIVTRSKDTFALNHTRGLGTSAHPYIIRNVEDMKELSSNVATGNTFENYYFEVVTDESQFIFDTSYKPIGSKSTQFAGYFNGNGVDMNLNINSGNDYIGLFGYYRSGIIENISISGTVIGNNYVGGLIGFQESGNISNIYNTANISATGSYAGGIIGYFYGGTVKNIYNRGNVEANDYSGGISSYSKVDNISYGYSAGSISANTANTYGSVSNYTTGKYVYYDLTVIAKSLIDKTNKPVVSGSTNILDTSQIIGNIMSEKGFTESKGWILKEQNDNIGYYPQLKYFSEHSNEEIRNRSLNSVKIEISDGMGTKSSPFLIKTVQDMIDLSNNVNKGSSFLGLYFKVDNVNEFDLGDFTPIGTQKYPFEGNFDGNGANFNLNIDLDINYVGLFGYFKSGTIENLSVSGYINGLDNVAGIVGRQDSGIIRNVYNNAIIVGNNYVSGIVGYKTAGEVSYTINSGDITANVNYAAGIAGYNKGVLSNSISYGGVSSKSVSSGIIANGDAGTNVFYDATVISNYNNVQANKPSTKIEGIAADTEMFILTPEESLSLNSTNWTFIPINNNDAYYPQLKYFATNTNLKIKTRSMNNAYINIEGGLGTKNLPKLIYSKADMDEISLNTSKKNSYENIYFKVADGISEIELGNFTPIGSNVAFKGYFDGNGVNFILEINNEDLDNQALFGQFSNGTIENLSVSGSVNGKNNVAGIVALQSSGTIKNVYNTANITAVGNYAAGIVGNVTNSGIVTNAFNKGKVLANDYAYGIGRITSGSITYVYNASYVSTYGTNIYGVSNVQNASNKTYYDSSILVSYKADYKYKPATALNDYSLDTGTLISLNMGVKGFTTNLGWTLTTSTTDYGYYPQLSIFANNSNTTIKENSLFATKVELNKGYGSKENPFIIEDENDMVNLSKNVSTGSTYEGFYIKVADGKKVLNLASFTPIGNATNKFKGNFDGNFAKFNLDINLTGTNYVGLFGYVENANIKNLSTAGTVIGSTYVGGVVGTASKSIIENVYNTANVYALTKYVGGIVGNPVNTTINETYNIGDITSETTDAGGISGFAQSSTFTNNYSSGTIIAKSTSAGGISGYASASTITNNYTFAKISATNYVNGIVGYIDRYNTFTNNYYDKTILEDYSAPYNKPSLTASEAVETSDLINDKLNYKGFDSKDWVFKQIENNYAYYPQLKVFASNIDTTVSIDSLNSVKTSPYFGDGSKDNPFRIRSVNDMINLSNSINEDYQAEGIYYLVEDLFEFDLTNTNFKAIGSKNYPFKGNFDGNYANFNVNIDNISDYQGLFGYTVSGTEIKNFSVTGIIKGNNYVGVIGYNQSNLSNIYTTATISGKDFVGGIAGYNNGDINLAYAISSIKSTNNYVGAIVGYNVDGEIKETYSASTVIGINNVGALVGYNESGNIEKSYYDKTMINFTNTTEFNKPTKAVSNNPDKSNLKGLSKDELIAKKVIGTESDQVDFNSDNWIEQENQSLYGYYLQLYGFAKNSNSSVIIENSLKSVKTIRFAAGNGSYDNPYIIRTPEDMVAVYQLSTESNLENVYFKVQDGIEELDLTKDGISYNPIGLTKPFKGNFNGNNAKFILNITRSSNYSALFGQIGEGGTVKNLSVEGTVSGTSFVSGIVGYSTGGIIDNVSNKATLSSTGNWALVGGIVGRAYNNTIITNVYNMGNITSSYEKAGGIVGELVDSNIQYAYNTGDVFNTRYHTGGIVGYASRSDISYVYNTGNIISNSSSTAGIIGRSVDSILDNAYSAGVIRNKEQISNGGIVGYTSGVTSETKVYYDRSIIDADIATGYYKPVTTVGNKKDHQTAKGVEKNYLTGIGIIDTTNNSSSSLIKLDLNVWQLKKNEDVNAYYPQLKVFSSSTNENIKNDSLVSVRSYVFVGEGTESVPYVILDAKNMELLSDLVNNGMTFEDTYFKIKDGIDLIDLTIEGINYEPIGTQSNPFGGNFDGNGANLVLGFNDTNKNNLALFGYTNEHAVISNLSTSGIIIGNNNIASIVAENYGLVNTVYSTTKINGSEFVGGIVGYNKGTVSVAYYNSTLEGKSYVGGIIGFNDGYMVDTYSVSKIKGTNNVGGLIGYEGTKGTSEYSYYNKTIIDVSKYDEDLKPSYAIGNIDSNKVDVYGTTNQVMTSGNLGSGEDKINFTDLNLWTPLAPSGYNTYYPQITLFATNKDEDIKNKSKESVTTSRFSDGDGSKEYPYIIKTKDDMIALSNLVKEGYTLENKYFKVDENTKVIYLSSDEFEPIGNNYNKFQGNFDGNNSKFTIDGIFERNYTGLFGYVGSKAVVRNLSVSGNITGQNYVGGIAGQNDGNISNVYNLASVNGTGANIAGIVGINSGTISNTYNAGNIGESISNKNNKNIGGIVGYNYQNALVENSYNTANILGYSSVGGIIGRNAGRIMNTYNIGILDASGSVGGIIGYADNTSTAMYSYYDISVITTSIVNNKPKQAISNVSNTENVFGVVTSQLSGESLYGITFDKDIFALEANNKYEAFHPQLIVFKENENATVQNDSLKYIRRNIFQGEGTEENPYLLINGVDLKALSILIQQQVETTNVYFKIYEENSTFDLTNNNLHFNSIGNSNNAFDGNFNGNNAKVILNLTNKKDNQGLFGVLGENSNVYNLEIEGNIYGNDNVGALVGTNNGSIYNIISNTVVNGVKNVGGIVGINNGSITDISNRNEVIGEENVGGLVGYNIKEIIYSYNYSQITGKTKSIGGLVGYATSSSNIQFSYNHGLINSTGDYVGGIVGINEGYIENVYNTSNIITDNKYVAGIAAKNSGNIYRSYHAGKIQGIDYTAGIVSENSGTVDYVYYDKTEIYTMVLLSSYKKVETAIYGYTDNEYSTIVKGLELKYITGLDAIGSTQNQMYFEKTLWSTKEGTDFISYYPELSYFKNHTNELFKNDSLESITNKKLDGSGTLEDPYLIYDGYDMNTMHDFVERGYTFTNKYFKVADGVSLIDLSLENIGYKSIGNDQKIFDGIFDGNNANFIIKFNNPDTNYLGIFTNLDVNSVVKNMKISGSIIGGSYLGALAGRTQGLVENVTNNATIKSTEGNNAGGISGVNDGTITNSVNKGVISINGVYAGGIAGQNNRDAIISNSYNKNQVKGTTSIGGIVGINYGTVENVYNNAYINGTTTIGGIAGENAGSITKAFNMNLVEATQGLVGGIAGLQQDSSAIIQQIYNTGDVSSLNDVAGGIVGSIENGSLIDAYNAGNVTGKVLKTKDKLLLGTIAGQFLNGEILNTYYDLNKLNNYVTNNNLKPEKGIGNVSDNDNIKGLYHGQMAGLNSIGDRNNQMNFSNIEDFLLSPSYDKYSFYPQFSYFANASIDEVKTDSLESVRSLTFVVGKGTEDDPYIIMNESDWIALAETVNSGNSYNNVYFKVDDSVSNFEFDSDITGYEYTAIGNSDKTFNGILDGSGINVNIKLNNELDYQALFGNIGPNGIVRNISVSGSIKGNNYVSGIAAKSSGLIENVYNQATIIGNDYVSGIVSKSAGTILNVYNRGEIKGNKYVGGISAYADGTINNTYNSGIIYGKEIIGAVAGFLNTKLVTNSYYDQTILNSYREVEDYIKPTTGVGNSIDSVTVKSLNKEYMTGNNAIGDGLLQMNFDDLDNWTTSKNIDDSTTNYPQLKVFSESSFDNIKELSKESTLTNIYKITYNFNIPSDETFDALYQSTYVSPNYHYNLYVPDRYGFLFKGWYYAENEDTPVNDQIKYTDENGNSLEPYSLDEDIALYAKWEITYHKVEFVDGDGRVLFTTEVVHNGILMEYPEDTIKVKKSPSQTKLYFFEKWDYNNELIIEDTQIKPIFKEQDRYLTITYLDGNNDFFKEVKVEYGQKTTPITNIPTKLGSPTGGSNDKGIAYKFTEWDFDFDQEIYENKTITPLFEEVDYWYNVQFYDYDDVTVLADVKVAYGKSAKTSKIPVKPDAVDRKFRFNGWDKDTTMVTEDMKVYATWEEEMKTFVVTFMDGNDNVFDSVIVDYGVDAPLPDNIPTKDPNLEEEYAYKFVEWEGNYHTIVEDTTVYPIFEKTNLYYTVEFVDYLNSTIIKYQNIIYGTSVEAPENPSQPDDEMYKYTFTGWDKDYTFVTEDLIIKPLYDKEYRDFTVTFYDGDDNIISSQLVRYGESAIAPSENPTKTYTDDNAYEFTNWDKEFDNVKSDLDIYPEFKEIDRYYYISYYYDDEFVYTEKVEYLHDALTPQIDFKEHSDISKEYYLIKWDKDLTKVTQSFSTNAIVGERLKTFEVKFIIGEEEVTQKVEYGKDAIAPSNPTLPAEEQYVYSFTGWDKDYTNITSNLIVTAIFEKDYNFFYVRFYDGDGIEFDVQLVKPGENANNPSNIPTKAKTTNNVYVFTGWDKSLNNIQEDTQINALFKEVDRYYEVTFVDSNYNQIGDVQTVEYGYSATAPIAPELEPEEIYEWVFDNWDTDFTHVTSNLTIKAIYKKQLRNFTVKFYDGDNNVINTQDVQYGNSAITPDDPTKTPSQDKYYIFNHWIQDYASVTSDLDVYPEFNEVDRYYNVYFIDEFGNRVADPQIVEYGHDATDPRDSYVPEIVDDNYIYTIVGWDKPLTNITKETIVYAQYDTIQRYYTVIFYMDEDLEVMIDQPQKVEYNTGAIAPEDPSKPSTDTIRYEFYGWSEDFSKITQDINVYAIFEEYPNRFTVTFLNGDGSVFYIDYVSYGEKADPNGIPYKDPTNNIQYIFNRWDTKFDNVTEDLTIKPIFDEETRIFSVIFKDDKGSILSEQKVAYGQSATEPKNITIPEKTDMYEYEIAWDKEFSEIAEDMIINLTFKEVLRKFTYTFYDYNNNIYKQFVAQYGSIIELPADPVKPMTQQFTYKFEGWSPEVSETLTMDVDYYPIYSEHVRIFTVTFLDSNDELFYQYEVEYGEDGSFPDTTPTKDPTYKNYYVFLDWDAYPINVRSDMIIKPIFDEYLQKFKVTFLDEFDTVLKEDEVEYGTGALAPEAPVKIGNQQYSYIFAGWTNPFDNVTEDITTKTKYTAVLNKYTYTFYDYDNTILKQVTDVYGTNIVAPDLPKREPEGNVEYEFAGWDKVVADKLTEDIEYIATYTKVTKKIQVIFRDGDGRDFFKIKVEYGTDVTAPEAIPTKTPTKYEQYVFSGWDGNMINITEDTIINALFKAEPRKYEVTFVDYDELVLGIGYVEYNQLLDIDKYEPATPNRKTGYRFSKWDHDLYNLHITEDITVQAIYEVNSYKVNFNDNGANSDNIMPSDTKAKYNDYYSIPANVYERRGYNFIGWKLDPNSGIIDYKDSDNFVFKYPNEITLYAAWKPIEYGINYEADGGTYDNPVKYNIETETFILNDAEKQDYKFTGWYLVSNDEEDGLIINDTTSSKGRRRVKDTTSDIKVTKIEKGSIGNITLEARYEYAGYIKLKDDRPTTQLGMFYADFSDIIDTIEVIEREPLNGEKPVYLLNVYEGQTIAELKQNFTNEGLRFFNADGNELSDSDIVRTGMTVELRDSDDNLLDRLVVILKGDVNGDGSITILDYNLIVDYISKRTVFESEIILSSLINEDNIVNILDSNLILDQISGRTLIS